MSTSPHPSLLHELNHVATVQRLAEGETTLLLPFEQLFLERGLNVLSREQQVMGQEYGAVMRQSSETWHDNAPAEAIASAARVMADRAERVIGGLTTAVVLGFPDPELKQVTLGSVVGLLYPGDSESEDHLLVGFCRDVPAVRPDVPFSNVPAIVTLKTPLGRALLGSEVGQTVKYEGPTGRDFSAVVRSLTQLQPEHLA